MGKAPPSVEVAAVTGSRASQIAALAVDDLQASGEPRLMMPTSKKGRGVKVVRRQPIPIPIPVTLAEKLRLASHADPIARRSAADPVVARVHVFGKRDWSFLSRMYYAHAFKHAHARVK